MLLKDVERGEYWVKTPRAPSEPPDRQCTLDASSPDVTYISGDPVPDQIKTGLHAT